MIKSAIERSREEHKQVVASLRKFLAKHFEDSDDDLKVTLLLDYLLVELGPSIYNQALADAQQFLAERIQDLGAVAAREEFPYWTRRRA